MAERIKKHGALLAAIWTLGLIVAGGGVHYLLKDNQPISAPDEAIGDFVRDDEEDLNLAEVPSEPYVPLDSTARLELQLDDLDTNETDSVDGAAEMLPDIAKHVQCAAYTWGAVIDEAGHLWC